MTRLCGLPHYAAGLGFCHMHLRGLPLAALNYLSPGRTACAVMPFQGTGHVPSPHVIYRTVQSPGRSTEKAEAEPEAIGQARA